MRFTITIAASLFCLTACASSGTLVTAQQATQFQRGKTTRVEVVGTLEAPSATLLLDNGARMDSYTHIQASPNIANFIPVADWLFSGASGATETATFIYDRDGVLSEITSGSGAINFNTGLLNQTLGSWAPTALHGGALPSRASDVTSAPADAAALRPAPPGAPAPIAQAQPAAPESPQRQCTQQEATQKRIAIQNGYTLTPNCQ